MSKASCPVCHASLIPGRPQCRNCGYVLIEKERATNLERHWARSSGIALICIILAFVAIIIYGAMQEPPVVAVQPPFPYSLLSYHHLETQDLSPSYTQRTRNKVLLALANSNDESISRDTLTATCMGAARFYTSNLHTWAVAIQLYDQPGSGLANTLLATCTYAKDGRGWSGEQDWAWGDMLVASRTTTQQEKEISRLWDAMRNQFKNKQGVTDERKLKAAIAKKLSIPVEGVTVLHVTLEPISPWGFVDVPDTGPTPIQQSPDQGHS